MYGMVNKAMEEMVCRQHGEEMWTRIKMRAGVEEDLFISNEGYPDEITYRLVGAASAELGMDPADILKAFGEHWVLHTASEGYGSMMRAGGKSLREFLVNLPNFHTRVIMIYPKLQPPGFACSDVGDRSLRLHYHTHRPGLTMFVVGLLQGLGRMFRTPVKVTIESRREEGAEHDVFLVEWEESTQR